jgi:putative ABC transport system permease protein
MYLRMITSSLVRRRSRMIVALLAVAIGATILSGLVTIYYDIPRQMGQEFRSYGANMILTPSGGGRITPEDAARAAALIPPENAVGIAPYRYENIKINEQPFIAAGTELEGARGASPYWFVSGRWPEETGEALIGQEVADIIGIGPGGVFTLSGITADGDGFKGEFTVSGVVQTGGAEEAFVFMSLEALGDIAGGGGLDVVECSVSAPQTELEELAERIGAGTPGVTARLVRRVTQSEVTVLSKLQALVYLVTAVVLMLTMICVATTMMAVVAERRREIGLKKALGAPNGEIIREFLGEGLLLGGLGGLLGAILGFVFAHTVSINVFGRPILFKPLLVPVTMLVSIAVTGLSCLLPVRRATDVDPAIVLRGE